MIQPFSTNVERVCYVERKGNAFPGKDAFREHYVWCTNPSLPAPPDLAPEVRAAEQEAEHLYTRRMGRKRRFRDTKLRNSGERIAFLLKGLEL